MPRVVRISLDKPTVSDLNIVSGARMASSVMSGLNLPATEQGLGAAFGIVDLAASDIGTGSYNIAATLQDAVSKLITLVQTITADGGFDAASGAYWSVQLVQNALSTFENGGVSQYFANDPSDAPFQTGEDFGTSVVEALTAIYGGRMPDTTDFAGQSVPTDTWPTDIDYSSVGTYDRETSYTYDTAGRLSSTIDPVGMQTLYYYDADGNVLQIVQNAGPGSGLVQSWYGGDGDGDGSGVQDGPVQRITSFVYDAAGRQIYSVNPDGAVTQTEYDAAGNAIATIQYANLISLDNGDSSSNPGASGYVPGVTLNYIEGQLAPDAAADRTTTRVFDQAGRAVYTVSSGGSVTQTSYDGAGRIVSTIAYANLVPVNAGYTAQTLAAALDADPAQDRTNTFVYDAAGNLIQSTDPTGASETYAYDGLGRKISYTDKNGGTYLYSYDADGRLLSETDPAVDVTTLQTAADGSLTTQGMNSTLESIVTSFSYDAFGNVLSETEAAGTAQARTTSYVYDAAGRQVKVIYPAVGVYDPSLDDIAANGMNGDATRTEDADVSLYTETVYDAFGDAVANRDVAGNISHKIYDNSGNVIYDIDADGYVTQYERDGFGQVATEIRYAQQVQLAYPVLYRGSEYDDALNELVPLTEDDIYTQQDGLDRAINYTYDAVG